MTDSLQVARSQQLIDSLSKEVLVLKAQSSFASDALASQASVYAVILTIAAGLAGILVYFSWKSQLKLIENNLISMLDSHKNVVEENMSTKLSTLDELKQTIENQSQSIAYNYRISIHSNINWLKKEKQYFTICNFFLLMAGMTFDLGDKEDAEKNLLSDLENAYAYLGFSFADVSEIETVDIEEVEKSIDELLKNATGDALKKKLNILLQN